MTAPFQTASLLCDSDGCDEEIIGSAHVEYPRDAHAQERAIRAARRKAFELATAAGWTVANHGKTGDWCPRCKEGK